jgi:hypothetical protein
MYDEMNIRKFSPSFGRIIENKEREKKEQEKIQAYLFNKLVVTGWAHRVGNQHRSDLFLTLLYRPAWKYKNKE